MTILFAGGEMTDFVPSDSSVYESTAAVSYNSDFARCSILCDTNTGYADSIDFGAQAEIWCHADNYQENINSPGRFLVFLDGSGAEVIRLTVTGSLTNATVTAQYYNLSAWNDIGSISLNVTTLHTYDIHIDCTGNTFALYIAGTERISGSIAGISGIAQVRLAGNNQTYWSQVIVADQPTIGYRLLTRYPNGTGANTDWTGGYTEVDETRYDDADFVNTSTANHVETFTQTGPAFTGYNVLAVAVSARGKQGGSGPSNLQLALRASSTDYFSTSKALGLGYAAYQNIWETNPATSAAWSGTAIDSLQPGVKAIT